MNKFFRLNSITRNISLNFLSRLTIDHKLALITFSAFMILAATGVTNLFHDRQLMLDGRHASTQQLVEVAHSVIAHYHGMAVKGRLDDKAVQQQAKPAAAAPRGRKAVGTDDEWNEF